MARNIAERDVLETKSADLLKLVAQQVFAVGGSQKDQETEYQYRSRIGLPWSVGSNIPVNAGLVTYEHLEGLFATLNRGCFECGERFSQLVCKEVKTYGVCIACELACSFNRNHDVFESTNHNVWFGSTVLADGTLKTNRNFVLSCIMVGMLPVRIERLAEIGQFGRINSYSISTVAKKLAPLAVKLQNKMIKKEIKWEISFLLGTAVMADARWGSPQRARKRSTLCTVTFLNWSSGGILGSISLHRSDLKDGIKDLAKLGCTILINRVVNELNLLLFYVHDGCGSDTKAVRESSVDGAPTLFSEDPWHFKKFPRRAWTDLLKANPKFTVLKEIGFKKLWNHFVFAHSEGFGNPLLVKKIIRGASKHFQDIHTHCLSEKCGGSATYELDSKLKIVDEAELAAFEEFLDKFSSMEKPGKLLVHCWTMPNYLCESIHNVMIKYAPKRISYGKMGYEMRIAFANLDLTENLKNRFKRNNTYGWIQKLKNMYFKL